MAGQDQSERVLGLDVGTNSVGWAVIEWAQGKPHRIVGMGSRVFPAGMDGSIEQGKEESRNRKRRNERLARRSRWRRKRRRDRIYRLLAGGGLLPEADIEDPKSVHEAIQSLDLALLAKFVDPTDHRRNQLLPYVLRKAALSERLELYEVGRALYHLGQRRGFLSNRKSPMRDQDELGLVRQAIANLESEMNSVGAPTLGAFLADADPERGRIRTQRTHRSMFEKEFDCIWAAQSKHHACMTEELADQLRKTMFFQRPLRSQKSLVGKCELEPGQRRASMALLDYQRFRLLQGVNHLEWCQNDGTRRTLEHTEREQLIAALQEQGDLTFAKIRRLLKLSGRSGHFNLEEGGEKRLCGNRTNSKLRALFEDRWDQLSVEEQNRVVHDLMSLQNDAALARRAEHVWALPSDFAKQFATLALEEGSASHSLRAIRKLLPLLEEGHSYAHARLLTYPGVHQNTEPVDRLPPVIEALPELRNPAVIRSLTEMRKVVNSVIARFGKPHRIRVEMARDVKQPKRRRQERWKKMRRREEQRAAAKRRIFDECGITNPSRSDIEKILLADECSWICPYTGRAFGMADLFGPQPSIDIEHILPFSRTLDNSLVNKTLCDVHENRLRKQNRTPFEAYGAMAERYDEILGRVARFQIDADVRRAKLERFRRRELGGEVLDAFSERQLSDTRYTSRLAADYAALLFGGRVDSEGRRRVDVSAGQATAILRRAWGLGGLLGGGGGKNRTDHRHHALDAVVVALTGPTEVKEIAKAAKRSARDQSHLTGVNYFCRWTTTIFAGVGFSLLPLRFS